MVKQIKKARIEKRVNRKQSLKKFFDSNCTDEQSFFNACKGDENLLIYTCLTKEEREVYFEKLRELEDTPAKIDYLLANQPFANETVERYDRVTKAIAKYLKGYIEYNGFRMSNAEGTYEDWTSEFWAKYCKVCDFYRTRWFFPEKLKKTSTVSHSPMLLKEIVYIIRLSISGERKHRAFLATQNMEDSVFKLSLDTTLEVGDNEKTLADVIPDEEHDVDYILDQASTNKILDKALSICKEYPDAVKYYEKIKDFYAKQDPIGFDKKTIILGKIFLYKAGLVSAKILAFVKALSATYKAKYNLSNAKINSQLAEYKNKKVIKYKKPTNENLGWRDLILRKRGEL